MQRVINFFLNHKYSIAGLIIVEISLLGFFLAHVAALCLLFTDNLHWLPIVLQGGILSCVGAIGMFALNKIKSLGWGEVQLEKSETPSSPE